MPSTVLGLLLAGAKFVSDPLLQGGSHCAGLEASNWEDFRGGKLCPAVSGLMMPRLLGPQILGRVVVFWGPFPVLTLKLYLHRTRQQHLIDSVS